MILENKFKQSEIVWERIRPSQKMVVEQCVNGIYYCKLIEAPHRKALVFLERDLMADKPNAIREVSSFAVGPFPLSKST